MENIFDIEYFYRIIDHRSVLGSQLGLQLHNNKWSYLLAQRKIFNMNFLCLSKCSIIFNNCF